MMKRLLSAAVIFVFLLAGPSVPHLAQQPADEAKLIAAARKIHTDVITLDTHVDINTANFTEKVNYTQELPIQVDLPKMKLGGLDVAWLIVYTGQGELNDADYKRAYANAIDEFDPIQRFTKSLAPNEIVH